MEKLIIYLHAHDLEHPSWAVLDAENVVRESAAHDNAEGLAQIAQEKDVYVIVPMEDVLLTETKLPKMTRSRLAQALPFALEEQLINDVDVMHFAPGTQTEEGNLHVAVVAKEKMQQWLALLQHWNIKADVLTPSVFALPVMSDIWHVAISDMVVARTSTYIGFACDHNNLSELLSIAIATSEKLPQQINLLNYTSHSWAANLTGPVTINENFNHSVKFIVDAAHDIVKAPLINLLQGAYAVKKSKLPQLGKVWTLVSYLAVAWAALLFFYPTISYFFLSHKLHAIDEQIVDIYKRNFPQATSLVAPKLRMEEKLQKLNAQIGENRFLLLVGYVGKGMQETQSIKLKRLDFQNNILTLELTAGSSDDFSAFTDFLTRQGLSVKQQNANLTDTRVSATLQVE